VGWGSSVALSCGVGHRCHSDPALLWLWCRLAAAAPTQPLAWEFPYATGAALKSKKKKKRIYMYAAIMPALCNLTNLLLPCFRSLANSQSPVTKIKPI